MILLVDWWQKMMKWRFQQEMVNGFQPKHQIDYIKVPTKIKVNFQKYLRQIQNKPRTKNNRLK